MSVTPIEMVSMAPKSQLFSQGIHTDGQRNSVSQSVMMNNMEQKLDKNAHATVETQKEEDKNNKFDAKEKGSNEYHNDGKKNKERSEKNAVGKDAPKIKICNFDISI